MKIFKTVKVERLDRNTSDGILKELSPYEAENSGQLEMTFHLNSTVGDIRLALELISKAHSMKNIDFVTVASGELGVAGTLLAAAGKPGFRSAKPGTTLLVTEGGAYTEEVKSSAQLEGIDSATHLTLAALTGRGKLIFNAIKSASTLSTSEAKKCNIIDFVPKFISKYRNPNGRTVSNAKTESSKSSESVKSEFIKNDDSTRDLKIESDTRTNVEPAKRRGRQVRK